MKAAVKTLLFTILVPGTMTVLIPRLIVSASGARPESIPIFSDYRIAGLFLIILGATVYVRCAQDFAFSGKGTPSPIDPPKILMTNRLYRVVRNPMYLGVGAIIAGESIAFVSSPLLLYAVCFLVGVHLFVVLYEEPHLRQTFGNSYDEYCKNVPRWIPRLKRPGS